MQTSREEQLRSKSPTPEIRPMQFGHASFPDERDQGRFVTRVQDDLFEVTCAGHTSTDSLGECDRDPADHREIHFPSRVEQICGTAGKLGPTVVSASSSRKAKPTTRSVGAIFQADHTRREGSNYLQKQEYAGHLASGASKNAALRTTLPNEPDYHDTPVMSRVSWSVPHEEKVPGKAFHNECPVLAQRRLELEVKPQNQVPLVKNVHKFQISQKQEQSEERGAALQRKKNQWERESHIFLHQDEDKTALEEQAAVTIQRLVRGVRTRILVRGLRAALISAVAKIQSFIRGHLDRVYAKAREAKENSSRCIQRAWRGYARRSTCRINTASVREHIAVRIIQKIVRGHKGRKRFERKRKFYASVVSGSDIVRAQNLSEEDIVQLADEIEASLHGTSVSSPPNIVLGLVKVIALMLEGGDGFLEFTWYDSLGMQFVSKLDPARYFSWRDALRLLRRSSKFLRQLRLVAEGPASKRPRKVKFSRTAVQTYRAVRCDQMWSITELDGWRGAKACQHLIQWVDSLQEVFAHQLEFVEDLGTQRVDRMERTREHVRILRHLDLSLLVWQHAVNSLSRGLRRGDKAVQGDLIRLDTISGSKEIHASVVERAVAILRERESSTRYATAKVLQDEEQAQRDDKRGNDVNIDILSKDRLLEESNWSENYRRLKNLGQLARHQNKAEQAKLELHENDLLASELTCRRRWYAPRQSGLGHEKSNSGGNIDIVIPRDLCQQARTLGEAEAALTLADEEMIFYQEQLESSASSHVNSPSVAELQAMQVKAERAEKMVSVTHAQLDRVEEEMDNMSAAIFQAELQQDQRPLTGAWEKATEEEREEDMREDERWARWESDRVTRFIPPTILSRPFERSRPVVVLVSRDVPEAAKRRIIRQMELDLPGFSVHIDNETKMGLCLRDLQQAITARVNVMCHVDTGLSERRRRTFLERLAAVKASLMPAPDFILIVGDKRNRSGGALETSFGCSERDLKLMGDGNIKRRLENCAFFIERLRCSLLPANEVKVRPQRFTSPSAYAIFMESLMVLLNPQMVLQNHCILSSFSAELWPQGKEYLDNLGEIWTAMAELDIFAVPTASTHILQEYVHHPLWPSYGAAAIAEDDALANLIAWVGSVVECLVHLERSGGPPASPSLSLDLLAAIIPVRDQHLDARDHLDLHHNRGWKGAYHQLLMAILEDVRVYRVARRIEGAQPTSIQVVEVYQECGRLFFFAYSPNSCRRSTCILEEAQIGNLLVPAFHCVSKFKTKAIPSNRREMFSHLVTMLRYIPCGAVEREARRLVCRRGLRLLNRETRRMSGHMVQLTVFEGGLHNFHFSVYLSHLSASLELHVNKETIRRILEDTCVSTGERDALMSEDTSRVVSPIMDRMTISPSRATMTMMYYGRTARRGRLSTFKGSFTLKSRRKGGGGNCILRTVTVISGTLHALSVWELGRNGPLRVVAYDPLSSMSYEAQLSEIERNWLGCGGGEILSWRSNLIRRLRLRRSEPMTAETSNVNDCHQSPRKISMTIDRTILSTACRVDKVEECCRLLRVQASLADAKGRLALDIYQIETSKHCRFSLVADDLWACPKVPHADFSVSEQAKPAILGAPPKISIEDTCPKINQSHTSQKLLTDVNSRRDALYHIMNNVSLEDGGRVSLMINGVSRTASLEHSEDARLRRLKSELRAESRRHYRCERVELGRQSQFDIFFARNRRQHDVFIYTSASSFVQSPKRSSTESQGANDFLRGITAQCKNEHQQEKMNRNVSDDPMKEYKAVVQGKTFIGISVPRSTRSSTQDDEHLAFKGAIPIRKDDGSNYQRTCDAVVAVYYCCDPDKGLIIRAVVYYIKQASYAEVLIEGLEELRQVVGPSQQALAYEWTEKFEDENVSERLFCFIFRQRAVIKSGYWDANLERFIEQGTTFAVVLKKSRVYRSTKQTPIHLSGARDQEANKKHLIDDSACRGIKVFREAVNINSNVFQVTAFELPALVGTEDVVPTLKFIAYQPRTQVQLIHISKKAAVLELAGGIRSPWLAADNRRLLARILSGALCVKACHDGSPSLVLLWSGEESSEAPKSRNGIFPDGKREEVSKLGTFTTCITGYEITSGEKPWLAAYRKLDVKYTPNRHKIRGQPRQFIPRDIKGDIVVSQGIMISGFKVLLSVSTKKKGCPGRKGLVWEAYIQEASASCVMHLSTSCLLSQVDDKGYLCDDNQLPSTVKMLMRRLLLRKTTNRNFYLLLDSGKEPLLFQRV